MYMTSVSLYWIEERRPFVSAFRGKGKKHAWQTWHVLNAVSDSFDQLSQYSSILNDENLRFLERFDVIMYDRLSATSEVADVKLDMFARKQRLYEAISIILE